MEPRKSDWLAPPVVLSVVGMIATIFGTYTSLDNRTTKTEEAVKYLDYRLNKIEDKLDRALEQRHAQ